MAEILIYDEIGGFGVRSAAFIAQLSAIPAGEDVTVRINSPGGEITEGVAIAGAIARRGGVTVAIDALCASIATVIACAGARVIMADGALFMIHNATWFAGGDADDLREAAATLEKFEEAAISAYERKTKLSRERIKTMMDAETWLTAQEALALGFVDEIAEPLKAAARARAGELAKRRGLTRALAAMSTATEDPKLSQTPDASPASPETPEPENPAPATPAAEPAEPATDAPSQAADLTELVAKFREQTASLLAVTQERDALKSENATLRAQTAELHTVRQNITNLKRSLGLLPAQEVPAIQPAPENADDEFEKAWKSAKSQGEKTRLANSDPAAFQRLTAAQRISF